jgi:hypothetical protein
MEGGNLSLPKGTQEILDCESGSSTAGALEGGIADIEDPVIASFG